MEGRVAQTALKPISWSYHSQENICWLPLHAELNPVPYSIPISCYYSGSRFDGLDIHVSAHKFPGIFCKAHERIDRISSCTNVQTPNGPA